ncbi:putative transcriptional regulator, MarR family protein [Lachnospiraceae bacterium TWA4]|nr:putative transcriptional regulator, MarR family protein [Lachnospiraceae bacterium TWA4]
METLSFKNKIWDFKKKVNEYFEEDFGPIVESHGLTILQYRILCEIEELDSNLTVGLLSKSVGLAKTNTSTLCKKMEKEGYIERKRTSSDERIVILKLQPKGHELVQCIKLELQKKYGDYIQSISEEDLKDIDLGLKKLEKF